MPNPAINELNINTFFNIFYLERVGIERSSQYPDSLQYINQLEDYSKYQRTDSVDETVPQRPSFVRPLHDVGDVNEGRNAHFEAQLTPVSDPTMRVEWYKDDKAITASKYSKLSYRPVL